MQNITTLTVRQAARDIRRILFRRTDPPVCRTVAEAWRQQLSPDAVLCAVEELPAAEPCAVTISLSPSHPSATKSRVVWAAGNAVEITVMNASSLFPLFSRLAEDLLDAPIASLAEGVAHEPTFPWLRNLSDFFVGSLRTAQQFDREGFVRQVARVGFTHMTINGLGVPRPYESGPPGDVYHWFYDYSPDMDQFVESTLLRGYYPPDYLRANREMLLANAALARKYGLIPGLHINSPRSMPEEFWHRYGHLRGARVDHPRETMRPRYTLAMAHPAVQRHYRELLRALLALVPDLGFVHIWTNDSGSGFEFVSSLYAGRNGGPYLLREWRDGDTIARAAAANVLTYYRLLRDEGRSVNPGFRVICDLASFYDERRYIIPGMGDGIDAGGFGAYAETAEASTAAVAAVGARVHMKVDLTDNNILGVPAPFLTYERLQDAVRGGAGGVLTGVAPPSLVPYDINAEVVRAVQTRSQMPLEGVLLAQATRWAGRDLGGGLVDAWRLSDAAVRAYPPEIPMSTFGFPWFRLWIRPFVPDIGAIPERERAYYEDFLLATFNNPARIDLNNDMMWNFLTVEEAGALRRRIEEQVLPPLDQAIGWCSAVVSGSHGSDATPDVIRDLHVRLRAARCYYITMQSTVAWTEAVHGYVQAGSAERRATYRALCKAMVARELANARDLLALVSTAATSFMPVSAIGESLHIYGSHFADQLKEKLRLMELHADDEPFIDPDFMWRVNER